MSDKDSFGRFKTTPGSTENSASGNNEDTHTQIQKLTAETEKNKLRIDSLEEKLKTTEETHKRVQEYTGSLKKDLETIGYMRLGAVLLSCIYIIILNLFMFCVIFYHKIYFLFFHSYTEAAFFIIIISSSALLCAAFLRGTFKTYADRHKENKTLEELKTIVEAAITKDNS